jgi:hypothetical protein
MTSSCRNGLEMKPDTKPASAAFRPGTERIEEQIQKHLLQQVGIGIRGHVLLRAVHGTEIFSIFA